MVAGVVGGLARHYGWNSNLVRAIYVVFAVVSAVFPGLLLYLLLWMLMPEGDA